MTTDDRSDRSAADRLRSQAQKLTIDLQEMGNIVGDAAQENLGQMREDACEYIERGRDEVQKAEHTIEALVRDRPFKSILIAACVGWFVGRFWKHR
jgi:ElaB/YqjD/DUF883 family membrane-anchored ribosome-binding protein